MTPPTLGTLSFFMPNSISVPPVLCHREGLGKEHSKPSTPPPPSAIPVTQSQSLPLGAVLGPSREPAVAMLPEKPRSREGHTHILPRDAVTGAEAGTQTRCLGGRAFWK